MSIPGLPVGSRAKVFRRICDQLRTDPTLSRVVKADAWDTWGGQSVGGQSADQMPGNIMSCPYVKLLPRLGTVGWYSPDAQIGPLEIAIEVGVDGLDACDCLNLWDAFERAIYPYDDHDKQFAFEEALRCLGAQTGQITFARPATVAELPDANNNLQFMCLGMMSIDVIRAFNP